jgi:hypothetical protein
MSLKRLWLARGGGCILSCGPPSSTEAQNECAWRYATIIWIPQKLCSQCEIESLLYVDLNKTRYSLDFTLMGANIRRKQGAEQCSRQVFKHLSNTQESNSSLKLNMNGHSYRCRLRKNLVGMIDKRGEGRRRRVSYLSHPFSSPGNLA